MVQNPLPSLCEVISGHYLLQFKLKIDQKCNKTKVGVGSEISDI